MTVNYTSIEKEATICDVLRAGLEWEVSYQGSYWKARSVDPEAKFAPNDRAYVVGRQNLILFIRAIV